MRINQRLILSACAAAVAVYAVWMAADRLYLDRRAELLESIERHETNLAEIREARRAHIQIRDQLQAIADQTLGSTLEVVEAQLRSRLNQIAREIGLAEPVVSTGSPKTVTSPAQRDRLRGNRHANQPDFAELEGTISGQGSLEQVVRLIHRIEREPWKKRIHSLSFDPLDAGERFAVTVRLRTLFLPTVPPSAELTQEYDAAGIEPYLVLASANPFQIPRPAEPVAVAQQGNETQGAPAYDYKRWRLTMITMSAHGWEAWLLDLQSQESRTLTVGESIRDVELVSLSEDEATFRAGDEEFVIAVGATLADRSHKSRGDQERRSGGVHP